MSTRAALRELIALLDEATGGHGYPRDSEAEIDPERVQAAARRHLDSLRPDPLAARHRAELAGDLCSVDNCLKVAHEGRWCHAHYPDEVAIQRAVQGQRMTLLPHERAEVFRRLADKGLTPAQISRHVGANRAAITKELAS